MVIVLHLLVYLIHVWYFVHVSTYILTNAYCYIHVILVL